MVLFKRILLAAFYATSSGLALALLFALYLGSFADLLGFAATLLLGILALAVLGWSLIPPERTKIQQAGLALVLGALIVLEAPRIRQAGTRLFFAIERESMDGFALDILAQRQIQGMSDGSRYFKELNGELVAYTNAEVDTVAPGESRVRVPLDSVLKRDGVSRERYEEYRSRLHRLHLVSFTVTDDYVAFVSDGFLDNLYGFVYVRAGRQRPALGGEFVEGTQLVSLLPMKSGWYYFTTT